MTSPDTLRWVAREFRNEAQGLVPTLDGFLGMIGPDVWSGPASDRMRGTLELERTALGDIAFELEVLATELEHRADAEERLAAERARAAADAQGR